MSIGTTEYIYNSQNRLETVNLPDGRTASYTYDPFNRGVKKEIAGQVTYYAYSDEGLIGEYSQSGNLQKAYGWKPSGMWGTDPVYMAENGQYYFFHNDHLGTPQRLTDINGNTVWSATYNAFSNAQVQVASIENNLRFPGQYFDEETGLHYN
ncbi:tRNA(Glu)-specific nuclease WapA [uncultured bacterium]|nr:tRNA(Glu)-specific nuclease WapA [uncultured bacterium]